MPKGYKGRLSEGTQEGFLQGVSWKWSCEKGNIVDAQEKNKGGVGGSHAMGSSLCKARRGTEGRLLAAGEN